MTALFLGGRSWNSSGFELCALPLSRQHLPNGEVASAIGKKCVGVDGEVVMLTACDGGAAWEAQGNGVQSLHATPCNRSAPRSSVAAESTPSQHHTNGHVTDGTMRFEWAVRGSVC